MGVGLATAADWSAGTGGGDSAESAAVASLGSLSFSVWRGAWGDGGSSRAAAASAGVALSSYLSRPEDENDSVEGSDDECGGGGVTPGGGRANDGNWGGAAATSSRLGLPPEPLSATDKSAAIEGGVRVSTVASAAAAGARLAAPPSALRLTDTTTGDDVSDSIIFPGAQWRSPVTGFVWAGSALVFATGSGTVWYVTPLGRARALAHLDAPNARDVAPLLALPDRLVFGATSLRTGRTQLRSRALSMLEPLVAAALDHAAVRPRPPRSLVGLIDTGVGSGFTRRETTPHAVVAALAASLQTSLILPPVTATTPSATVLPHPPHTRVTGQAAISALALRALTLDYTFVRGLVARYAGATSRHVFGGGAAVAAGASSSSTVDPHAGGTPAEWGVSRALIGALEEASLFDLASYAASGPPEGVAGLRTGTLDDVDARAAAFCNEWGFPAKAVVPSTWKASLAVTRGRWAESLWALISTDARLVAAVRSVSAVSYGGGPRDAEHDTHAVFTLPDPSSPLAARCRALGSLAKDAGESLVAALAFDIAGDHAAALHVWVTSPPSTGARGDDAALAAFANSHRDKRAFSGEKGSWRGV